MNDLDLVRAVYDAPPSPSEATTAAARAHMLSQGDRPATHRTWRVPRRWCGLTLVPGGDPVRPSTTNGTDTSSPEA